jgi:hypothetical protein
MTGVRHETSGQQTRRRTPPWLVAFASFVGAFAVAELTGVRALGGVVLALGGAWCFAAVRERAGTARAAAVLLLALALFVVSHPLGDAIGAWAAVLLSAALVAGAVRACAP